MCIEGAVHKPYAGLIIRLVSNTPVGVVQGYLFKRVSPYELVLALQVSCTDPPAFGVIRCICKGNVNFVICWFLIKILYTFTLIDGIDVLRLEEQWVTLNDDLIPKKNHFSFQTA